LCSFAIKKFIVADAATVFLREWELQPVAATSRGTQGRRRPRSHGWRIGPQSPSPGGDRGEGKSGHQACREGVDPLNNENSQERIRTTKTKVMKSLEHSKSPRLTSKTISNRLPGHGRRVLGLHRAGDRGAPSVLFAKIRSVLRLMTGASWLSSALPWIIGEGSRMDREGEERG
jgi:hypothetical protein